jgi:hypothetical protein
MIDKSNSHSQN